MSKAVTNPQVNNTGNIYFMFGVCVKLNFHIFMF